MLTLDIEADIEQQLNAIAKQSGKPTEQLLKEMVLDYLDDYQDTLEAEKILKAIDNGTEKVFSLAEAKKRIHDLAS